MIKLQNAVREEGTEQARESFDSRHHDHGSEGDPEVQADRKRTSMKPRGPASNRSVAKHIFRNQKTNH